MIIKQTTKRGRILMSPVDNKSIFRHCADGQYKVTKVKFYRDVEPLLLLHGISKFEFEVEIEDQK